MKKEQISVSQSIRIVPGTGATVSDALRTISSYIPECGFLMQM